MMMPGHTHEDIDAMFRFIADSLRAKGLVRTIEEFEVAATMAFKQQNVHVEHVATVYDVTSWMPKDKSVLGNFKLITTARYFIIAKRESDGMPVMWYKPHAAHEHLYPTLKDSQSRMARYNMDKDGKKQYVTDMEGIEIFKDLPTGQPELQHIEADRLDVAGVHASVKEMMRMIPSLFDDRSTVGEAREACVWAQSTYYRPPKHHVAL